MALAIGIVSGFASTGINQVWKQFTKEDEEFFEEETEDDLPLDEEEIKEEV